MDYVEINGARLAYRICGPEDGPLFITLHGGRGFGSHKADFKAYSPLAQHGFRVLSFDYRGHGQSAPTPPYTFAQIVDDIDGVRRHFAGDRPAVVCGGSFGGFLAQQYAITYGGNVSRLILRGTAASYEQEDAAVQILEQRIHKAPSFSVAMLRNKVFGAFASDDEFRLVHLAMLPLYSERFDADAALAAVLDTAYSAASHNALYSAAEKYFDYRAALPTIAAPTLVVVGAEDWICPLKFSEELVAGIPGAELFVVKGANHSVHLEKNAEVVARIVSFLGGGMTVYQPTP